MDVVSLVFQLYGIESNFLAHEHEFLHAAACPTAQPMPHRGLQPRSTDPPQPPSAEALAGLHVTVGTAGVRPLKHAVEEVRCPPALHSPCCALLFIAG